jgi:hypothetical protein
MNERDMEELIAKYPDDFFPRKHFVLVGRQQSFEGVGRFDLLFEDESKWHHLMELKARTLRYEDADQVARYYDELKSRGFKLLMWLVAPRIPPSMQEFLGDKGIEYREIHVAEFRHVADRHGFVIKSERGLEPIRQVIEGSAPNMQLAPSKNNDCRSLRKREVSQEGLPGPSNSKAIPNQAEVLSMPERDVTDTLWQNETMIARAVSEAGRKLHERLRGASFSKKQFENEIVPLYRPGSVLASDYCYNRINEAKYSLCFPFFEYCGRNSYRYLGPHFSFKAEIEILWKPAGGKGLVVGRWQRDRCYLRYDPRKQ